MFFAKMWWLVVLILFMLLTLTRMRLKFSCPLQDKDQVVLFFSKTWLTIIFFSKEQFIIRKAFSWSDLGNQSEGTHWLMQFTSQALYKGKNRRGGTHFGGHDFKRDNSYNQIGKSTYYSSDDDGNNDNYSGRRYGSMLIRA